MAVGDSGGLGLCPRKGLAAVVSIHECFLGLRSTNVLFKTLTSREYYPYVTGKDTESQRTVPGCPARILKFVICTGWDVQLYTPSLKWNEG
jgi:hypothetical protein